LLLRTGIPKAAAYPVCVSITIVGGDGFNGQRRDLDNCAKAVIDALKKAERIVDDTCEYVSQVTMQYRRGKDTGKTKSQAVCLVSFNPVSEEI
jgi:Holliday junction resolvase RusA-like endonuclease